MHSDGADNTSVKIINITGYDAVFYKSFLKS